MCAYVSSPNGNYAGCIAVDPIGKDHAILMEEFSNQELGRLYRYVNTYESLVVATRVDATTLDTTHVANLERGFDAVYRDWSFACRRAERKARQSGVVTKIADTEEEWREYY